MKLNLIGVVVAFVGLLASSSIEMGCANRKHNWDADTIHWRPEAYLTTADFKGVPEDNSDKNLAVHIFLSMNYNPDADPRYETFCYFQRDSWIRKNTSPKIALQSAEVFFNLGEIFRRKLQLVLEQGDTLRDERTRSLEKTSKELQNMCLLFNEESNWGADSLKVNEWKSNIKTTLERTTDSKDLTDFQSF